MQANGDPKNGAQLPTPADGYSLSVSVLHQSWSSEHGLQRTPENEPDGKGREKELGKRVRIDTHWRQRQRAVGLPTLSFSTVQEPSTPLGGCTCGTEWRGGRGLCRVRCSLKVMCLSKVALAQAGSTLLFQLALVLVN